MALTQYEEIVEDSGVTVDKENAGINGLQMKVGKNYVVQYIHGTAEITLHRLMNFGFVPESVFTLEQKKPVYIIKIDETELALDKEVIRCMYVKPCTV